MKLRHLTQVCLLQLALFSVSAHADIILHAANGSTDEDYCKTLPGNWLGNGTVTAMNDTVKCNYEGHAVISSSSTPNNYNVDINLNKTSGSFLCESHAHFIFLGGCENNSLVIKTDQADLTGTFQNDGYALTMLGTVQIPIKSKTVTANANIWMGKQ